MPDARYITVKPTSGVSSDQARDARARAWSYVFECFARHTKKRGRFLDKSGPDDARKDQDAGTYPHCT
jgi:hypothetical protein